MMVHVFVATKIGWDKERDMIWFDTNQYTYEEAVAQFIPVEKETLKANNRWYKYTAYEYDGVLYHDFGYLGIHDYDNPPPIL